MAYGTLNHHAGASPTAALDAIVKTSRLRQNAQGYWQIVYSEPNGGGSGKGSGWRSKTFSTQSKDFAAAQRHLTEWLTNTQQQRVTVLGAQKHTVGSLIDLYLASLDPARRKVTDYILRPVRTLLGGLEPRAVNQQIIQGYMQAREKFRGGGPVKTGTLRRELSGMLTAINYAIGQRIIANGDGPAKLRLPDNSPPRTEYMSHEEEQRFWAAAQAKGGAVALFVALGLDTAARRGAIIGLTWDRVDLKTKLIDFRDPRVRASRKRRAVVPISDRLLPVLERAHAESGGHGPLFNGKLRHVYRNFTIEMGMEWVTAHIMRHTWASLAAIDGAPMFHIARMLGDSIVTVENTYAKLQPQDLRDIVNRRWSAAK